MPLGIGLGDRVPDDFFRENRFPVNHRRNLAIASSQIETDAASFQVTAEGSGSTVGFGKVVRGAVDDFKGFFKDAASHHVGIPLAKRVFLVVFVELITQLPGGGAVNLGGASGPEQEFYKAFEEEEIMNGGRFGGFQDGCFKMVGIAIRTSEHDRYGLDGLGSGGGVEKGALGEHGRAKVGVQFRNNVRCG